MTQSSSPTALETEIHRIATAAREASRRTAELDTRVKNAWLLRVAERLEAAREEILRANEADIEAARAGGLEEPMLKRLALAGGKWRDMISGLHDVATLPDPVGEITQSRLRPNGLRVGRMRIPLGVIAIVYESRPNVTVDAAALCVKSGNAVILRGGSEAIRANLALGEQLRAAARDVGIPEDAVSIVPVTDRAAIDCLLRCEREIDLVIPRGGPGLIRRVTESSRIPVIKHDAGVCHVFLDESAEEAMSVSIVIDSKVRQMAVCNGLETLLVHAGSAARLLPPVGKALREQSIEIRGCERTRRLLPDAVPAREADWAEEFLGPVLAVCVVDDLEAAIAHIRSHGSNHTEVIVTRDHRAAQEFVRRVDSSTVGVNCSTAFADGQRLGLGAEIGISTSKLHAYGPMGLEELTTRKFVLFGDGQLRE